MSELRMHSLLLTLGNSSRVEFGENGILVLIEHCLTISLNHIYTACIDSDQSHEWFIYETVPQTQASARQTCASPNEGAGGPQLPLIATIDNSA